MTRHNDPVDGLVGDLHDHAKPPKALPSETDAALTRALADAWDQGYSEALRRWTAFLSRQSRDPRTNPYREATR